MIDSLKLLDRNLFLKINSLHSPFLDTLMWQLSASWHTYLLVAFLGYIFYKKFSPRKMLEFIIGCAIVVACTDLSTNIVKHQVQRYRPSHNLEIQAQVHSVNDYKGGKYGFFSSHASNTFGLAMFAFLCMYWMRARTKLLFFLYPLIVGYSRIYLGVHYPGDIFAGMLSGLFFGWLVYLVLNTYFFSAYVEKT